MIKLVECFVCAMERSLSDQQQSITESNVLVEFLHRNGLRKWEVPRDGLCLVESWFVAMDVHLQKPYSGGKDKLKSDAVQDMRDNPLHYQLVGDYEHDLDMFMSQNDYTANSIDLLPHALANVTGISCVILHLDRNGEVHTYHIRPTYDDFDQQIYPEITLLFSASRQHYDVPLTFSEYEQMEARDTNGSNIIIDLCNDDVDEMYSSIDVVDDSDNESGSDVCECNDTTFSNQDEENVRRFLEKKPVKELKSLSQTYNISIVNVVEKTNLVNILASNPSLQIFILSELKGNHMKKRGKKTDDLCWEGKQLMEVDQLPFDINGDCMYKLKYDSTNRLKSSVDGRPWEKSFTCNTKAFPNGQRKAARCSGSYCCSNDTCMFSVQYGERNDVHYKISTSGTRMCKCCNHVMQHIPCAETKKLWEFYTDYVIIKHQGIHTCRAKVPCSLPEEVSDAFRKNPKTKPSKLQRDILVNSLHDGCNINAVKEMARNLLDKKKIRNEKQKQTMNTHPFGHSFDAVVNLKKQLDPQDPCLIFELNGEGMNMNPAYVFKSSTCMAKIALQMDQSAETHFMSKEWAFFDAAHKRCRGFKTFSITTYHPLLKKIVKLATMECRQENTDAVRIMWTAFNRLLATVSGRGESYKFNPSGWMVDEAGSNWKGLKEVYGEDVQKRIVSCQFHYQQSRNEHRRKLTTQEECDIFTDISDALFNAVTPSAYMDAYDKALTFIKAKPHRELILFDWLTWWYSRRAHVFPAFRPLHDAPSTNLAESFNSIWSNSGTNNLSLVDAAYYDTVEAMILESELDCFRDGTFKGGDGPDCNTREQKHYQEQMKRSRAYAEELTRGDGNLQGEEARKNASEGFFSTNSSHRPDKPKRKSSEYEDCPSNKKSKSTSDGRDGKWRRQKSKMFLQSLKKAKEEPFFLDGNPVSQNEFRVYSVNSKCTYIVKVSKTPCCQCAFFTLKQNKSQQMCKHIVWVYLFVLRVPEESKLINQVALLESEVQQLFSNIYAVIPRFLLKRASTSFNEEGGSVPPKQQSSTLTDAEKDGVFAASKLSKLPQVWKVAKEEKGKEALCAACRKSKIVSGRLFVQVTGLYIPRNCTFCVSRTFYFCAALTCLSKTPIASNLNCPPNEILVEENSGLNRQDYELLVERGLPMV